MTGGEINPEEAGNPVSTKQNCYVLVNSNAFEDFLRGWGDACNPASCACDMTHTRRRPLQLRHEPAMLGARVSFYIHATNKRNKETDEGV